jgi:hypothetical protein
MTDRELLELAAKAAGHELLWTCGGIPVNTPTLFEGLGSDQVWNPLLDDGDALRLAVKLGIDIVVSVARPARSAACPPDQIGAEHYLEEDHNDDPYAATRRAVVRAAAEVGKVMP